MRRQWQTFLLERLAELRPVDCSLFEMAEIGVGNGDTSALCMLKFPTLCVAMIDPWHADPAYIARSPNVFRKPDGTLQTQDDFDQIAEQAIAATEFAKHRRRIYRMTSRDAAGMLPDDWFSLIFIDGDHCEEAVARDCRDYWPKLKRGGIFSGHDYGHRYHPGVKRAVDAWSQEAGVKLSFGYRSVWWTVKP